MCVCVCVCSCWFVCFYLYYLHFMRINILIITMWSEQSAWKLGEVSADSYGITLLIFWVVQKKLGGIPQSPVNLNTDRVQFQYKSRARIVAAIETRNLSGDEIVNVNFLRRHWTDFLITATHLRPSNRVISLLLNSPSLKWTRPSNPPQIELIWSQTIKI